LMGCKKKKGELEENGRLNSGNMGCR
jgi:hypothetical protein